MSAKNDRESRRFHTALGMFQAGVDLMRQNLRRADPTASEPEIRTRVGDWLRARQGAEGGDGEGRLVPWPRPIR